jgi:hypothetical protein
MHLTGSLKEALRDQKFSRNEVKEAVQEWLKAQPKRFILMDSGNLWTAGPNAFKSGLLRRKMRHA